MPAKKLQNLICLTILILMGLIAYEPMRHNGFVDYDDEDYVTKNTQVLQGLTKEGFIWSFTETDRTANWHPLTWLSHMLDVQLFGTNPLWHHLVSLLFHLVNTLLLFGVFAKMTKAIWQSFFIAAVFALHPLHVESVAWVAERKDVLSGFFWMLTIAAYVFYTERPSVRRYVWVILFFILGLMAKPMLVTLPFVLLLLDYWPLGRFNPGQQYRRGSAPKLIAEKLPLFLLSTASSAIAFVVQQRAGAMLRGENYSLLTRISNAAVAYISYIVKLIYPVKLAVLYPHPGSSLPLWQPIAAAAALVLITAVVFTLAVKKRFLLVGWLWYIGTLVPVIGLVQVGSQAIADRYTYLPAVGLFIMFAWGIVEILNRWKYKTVAIALSGSLVLLALVTGTRNQVSCWRDTLTLYKHTLEVTKNNYVIHGNYGYTLQNHGDIDAAIEQFNKAMQLKPDYVGVMNNLGMALRSQGKIDDAIVQWRKALALEPYNPNVNANMGLALAMQGHNEEAIKCLNITLQRNPAFPGVHLVLGDVYFNMEKFDLAAEHFTQAVKEQPQNTAAINSLAIIYAQQGKMDEAIKRWQEILTIDPKTDYVYQNLGFAMAQSGQHHSAIGYYNTALQLDSNQPEVLGRLAVSYAAIKDFDQAIKVAQKAYNLAINSGNAEMAVQIQKQIKDYKTLLVGNK